MKHSMFDWFIFLLKLYSFVLLLAFAGRHVSEAMEMKYGNPQLPELITMATDALLDSER